MKVAVDNYPDSGLHGRDADVSEHFFRRESGRMVAALTRIFGPQNLPLAEDGVQEAFCRAMEVWKFTGVPENPSAWLMATAKNCTLDALRRNRTAQNHAPALARSLENGKESEPTFEEFFGPAVIRDDLLRMMFSCCPPRVPEAAQVALVLNILCGFSVDEIANAFVSSHAAIEKRITRAKKILAKSKRLFEIHRPRDFTSRLPTVLGSLYLLFNEGYHGASAETTVRSELCHEAMRLTALLLEHPLGRTPPTYALAALMCFDAARLPARVDEAGNLSSLYEQDRSLWDRELVAEGRQLLELSASGLEFTQYHIEAAIASVHSAAARMEDTDWGKIVSLYDTLMTVRPSPVVALNRAIAIAQRDGPRRGLDEIAVIEHRERLASYPFYDATLGELELRLGHAESAREHFRTACELARNPMERQFLDQRILACDSSGRA